MPYDYQSLFSGNESFLDDWNVIYNHDLSFPENLLNLLKKTVYLPLDFYDIITTYYLLPSALCHHIPYLFFYGRSGSGKSTLGKIPSILHNVPINSPSDTFASIRNSLSDRKYGYVEVDDPEGTSPTWRKSVELNTAMIWDDIDPSIFNSQPNLYRMFKFGDTRGKDKITVSSVDVGKNLEFKTFCPKILSSIHPLHLDPSFKELQRRLIVVPCKRIEDISSERLAGLGTSIDNWSQNLIDLETINWDGFSDLFEQFWDLEAGKDFLEVRKILSKTSLSLTSRQRAICLDLIAVGVTCGIWSDELIAQSSLKKYYQWYDQEIKQGSGLTQLLIELIKTETRNSKSANTPVSIPVPRLRILIQAWLEQGLILEKPPLSSLKATLRDLGMRLERGFWVKDQ